MANLSHSTKRKRDLDNHGLVTLSLSAAPTSAVGPVVVTFPALQPALSTAFKSYVKRPKTSQSQISEQDFATQGGVIAGETDTVEFYTAGTSDANHGNESCQYLIGVHDKTTNKVTLRRAPMHVLKREVKALKSLDPPAVALASEERVQARNVLGEAFGSKKAKQAIRAAERNRVDVSAMEGVAGHLQDTIDAGTGSLPSQEAAKAAADENRPIPRCNIHAKMPDEIYALHDIVPESELNSISVAGLLSASDEKERKALLPYQRSSWVNQHLATEFSAAKPNKINLKILYYISSMLVFRNSSYSVDDKSQLQKRMASVPNDVIEGLLGRFTERSRNSTKAQVTKQTQTLLLTHMFALCLRIDRFATDPTLIATDLSMSVSAVTTHFKQLGCKVDNLTAAERMQLGLGPAIDKEPKRCILRIPLEFPKQRVKRRN